MNHYLIKLIALIQADCIPDEVQQQLLDENLYLKTQLDIQLGHTGINAVERNREDTYAELIYMVTQPDRIDKVMSHIPTTPEFKKSSKIKK